METIQAKKKGFSDKTRIIHFEEIPNSFRVHFLKITRSKLILFKVFFSKSALKVSKEENPEEELKEGEKRYVLKQMMKQ